VSAADFVIRRAGPADVPELARLRYEFRSELYPAVEEETPFLERFTNWMKPRLAPGGAWRCWVAISGGRLVGTLWLGLIEKLPNPAGHLERHAYVSSVYVVPELRNSGIGSALLTTCLDECRAKDVDSVLLWPTSRSRALYERHGFAVRDDLQQRR
jgi:GNAT superfamily N-acetyltransferase